MRNVQPLLRARPRIRKHDALFRLFPAVSLTSAALNTGTLNRTSLKVLASHVCLSSKHSSGQNRQSRLWKQQLARKLSQSHVHDTCGRQAAYMEISTNRIKAWCVSIAELLHNLLLVSRLTVVLSHPQAPYPTRMERPPPPPVMTGPPSPYAFRHLVSVSVSVSVRVGVGVWGLPAAEVASPRRRTRCPPSHIRRHPAAASGCAGGGSPMSSSPTSTAALSHSCCSGSAGDSTCR